MSSRRDFPEASPTSPLLTSNRHQPTDESESSDGTCACLFEADERDDVRAVNERAAVPYDRIDTATTLTAEGLPRTVA